MIIMNLLFKLKKSETPLIKTKSYSNYNSIVTNKELNIENVDYSYNELEEFIYQKKMAINEVLEYQPL